ncbi:S-layer homology domain-containing protein [Paenibacillus psychroresistens]|nr:S-layer homology domain-containing protein [Paenibacillus psychroresistens]
MKRTREIILSIALSISMILAVFPSSAHAVTENQIVLDTGSATTKEGSTFMVHLKGINISDMYALQFTLAFDEAYLKLEAISFENGYVLSAINEQTENHHLQITYALLNNTISKTNKSTLEIAEISFKSLKTGVTTISLNNMLAYSLDLNNLAPINENLHYELIQTIEEKSNIPTTKPTSTPSPVTPPTTTLSSSPIASANPVFSPINTFDPKEIEKVTKGLELTLEKLTKQHEKDKQFLQREAIKAVEAAIEKQSELNVSNSVIINGNVATLKMAADQFTELFKTIYDNAEKWNDLLKELDSTISKAKVTVTLNLGVQASKEVAVQINADIIQKAKANGIDVISIKVNGVSLAVDVDQFQGDTILNIAKQPASAATNATDLKLASEVFSFEFLDSSQKSVVFTKPVVIKLPIANAVGFNTDILTLAKIIDGKLEFYGGQYMEEGHYFESTRKSFSTYVIVENKVAFNDTSSVQSWAGKEIAIAAAKGIVQGRGDQKFVPNEKVTRAEFATMIVKAFHLEDESATSDFKDVKDKDWYKSAVAVAARDGLINGRTQDQFVPNDFISRAEMATIAARALKFVKGYKNSADANEALVKFKDAALIHPFLKEEVALTVSLGIVKGVDSSFNPNGLSSRAEATVVISRLLNL